MPYTHRVPSAHKIVSAVMMAGFAFLASEMFKPLMPEETVFGKFSLVNTVIGLLCGWRILGNRTGNGYSDAISGGLTSTGMLILWALFIQSLNEMLKLAMRNRFDGLMEGLAAVFEISIEFISYMGDGPFLMFLILGSILIGVIAERVHRRYAD